MHDTVAEHIFELSDGADRLKFELREARACAVCSPAFVSTSWTTTRG
jgi:hypothetical protein